MIKEVRHVQENEVGNENRVRLWFGDHVSARGGGDGLFEPASHRESDGGYRAGDGDRQRGEQRAGRRPGRPGEIAALVIYRDNAYMDKSQEAAATVATAIEDAKKLMKSEENRRKADAVAEKAKAYTAANNEYRNLEQTKMTAGKVQLVEASAKVQDALQRLLARRQQFLQERSRDSDKGKVTEYDAIQKTLLVEQGKDAFNEARVTAQKYQLAITPEERDTLEKEWMAGNQATQKALEQCRAGMNDAESKQHVDEALQALTTYETQVSVFRKVALDQSDVQSKKQRPAAEGLMAEAGSLCNGVYAFIDKTKKDADAQVAVATLMINTVSISAVIIGVLAAIFITRSITKPINRIIAGLTEGAEQVASASGQVSAASQSLAEGATEQAAGLEETSSSLEEMSSMTKQNADNAQQANTLAAEAQQAAATGSESMGRMNAGHPGDPKELR